MPGSSTCAAPCPSASPGRPGTAPRFLLPSAWRLLPHDDGSVGGHLRSRRRAEGDAMLTAEENEVLCRVGPGTPMGTVLRRYWTPAFQLGDLPAPDCPPVRVTILGENFVAFRDTSGRLGFLDELCCHRGASLALGRVEDCGIRCLYHGWKYAVDGTIMETPNLPTPTFRERVKHGAYPVREAGGVAGVYLGPPGAEPPFPAFGWASAPADEIVVS